MAQLDVLNAVRGINTEADYLEFRDLLAHYFAEKAQKAIDTMWSQGTITDETISNWGKEPAN